MSAAVEDPDGAVAALYRLPLDQFVAARDQLARQLRAAGQRDAARQVAALRRPPVSAWAANQLAQVAPSAMAELLDAGAALQAAQQAALAGQPDAARALRTAGAHLRAAIARLTQRAETLLQRAGHAASDTTLLRLAATLQAAATGDAATRAALVQGRLAGDLDPAGFGLPSVAAEPATAVGSELAASHPAAPPGRAAQERVRARQAAARALEGTRRAAEQARAALQQALAVLEPAHHHDPVALGQGLGGMLGLVAPHHHGEERRLTIPAAGDGHPERRPRDAALGVPQLGLVGEGAGEADAGLWHAAALLGCLAGRAALPLDPGHGDALACRKTTRGKPRSQRTRPEWIRLPSVLGSGAELVWGRGLRLGVGHATTVRPDPSTLGVVGDRGSHREGACDPSQAR
jgi:hypothetical protein